MKQYEAVIQAMRENGGYATLGRLYRTATRIPGCAWGTKTPFASIRRIVQTRPEFFRIRPGLWGLTEQKQAILDALQLPPSSRESAQDFDHSYFQGLLAEIGRMKGYSVFIPRQDRNKPFLGGKLGDLPLLADCPTFTYDDLVHRARTMDVSWFNERGFPHMVFEVEHSTDIHNSLLKFLNFQDFRMAFVIVADRHRKAEFENKFRSNAFQPIRTSVKFWDYELVARYHADASSLFRTERALGM